MTATSKTPFVVSTRGEKLISEWLKSIEGEILQCKKTGKPKNNKDHHEFNGRSISYIFHPLTTTNKGQFSLTVEETYTGNKLNVTEQLLNVAPDEHDDGQVRVFELSASENVTIGHLASTFKMHPLDFIYTFIPTQAGILKKILHSKKQAELEFNPYMKWANEFFKQN